MDDPLGLGAMNTHMFKPIPGRLLAPSSKYQSSSTQPATTPENKDSHSLATSQSPQTPASVSASAANGDGDEKLSIETSYSNPSSARSSVSNDPNNVPDIISPPDHPSRLADIRALYDDPTKHISEEGSGDADGEAEGEEKIPETCNLCNEELCTHCDPLYDHICGMYMEAARKRNGNALRGNECMNMFVWCWEGARNVVVPRR
jgi:hypothetical protein